MHDIFLVASDDSYLGSITPTRQLNALYIYLDIAFLIVLTSLLLWKKRYQTVLWGLFGGVLYTVVDYGGFYLLSHTRTVSMLDSSGVFNVCSPAMTFLILLWMSMSYGFTNFVFIWVLMNKDKYRVYWIFLICMWWFVAPSIAELGGEATIETKRTTGAYHGWMAVILVISYLILTIVLLRKQKKFTNILYLCLIGVSVQFAWELALLVNGIRPLNASSLRTIIVNSLIETNLGMPLMYLLYYLLRKWRNEDMTKINNDNPIKSDEPLESKAGEN